MSETLAVSVFGAISVMGGAIYYLYRQNKDLYDKIMANMSDHAKCMEQSARTDERAIFLMKRVAVLEVDLQSQKVKVDTITTSLPSVSVPAIKDTTVGK